MSGIEIHIRTSATMQSIDEQIRGIFAAVLGKPAAPPPDPRIARERTRREIDAVLREDARRFPAFATARRAAIMASVEHVAVHGEPFLPDHTYGATDVKGVLCALHIYEEDRGGARRPSDRMRRFLDGITEGSRGWVIYHHYERARGLR